MQPKNRTIPGASRRAVLGGAAVLGLAAIGPARAAARLVSGLSPETPEAFILRQFAAADVVLLSEDHGLRQNLAFLKSLIPRLYEAGVGSIAMEFGGVEQQGELDRLVTAPHYDEVAARNLMFRYDSGWPLRDY